MIGKDNKKDGIEKISGKKVEPVEDGVHFFDATIDENVDVVDVEVIEGDEVVAVSDAEEQTSAEEFDVDDGEGDIEASVEFVVEEEISEADKARATPRPGQQNDEEDKSKEEVSNLPARYGAAVQKAAGAKARGME